MTPGKGSKYREFYDLSGRITCMPRCWVNPLATWLDWSLVTQEIGVRFLSDSKAFSPWNYFNGGSSNSVTPESVSVEQ